MQSLTCLILGCVLIVAPYLLITFLALNFHRLKESKYRQRFGLVYEELSLKTGRKVFLHPAFFLFRRLALAIALVAFKDYLCVQITVIWLQSTASFVVASYA